MFHRPPPAPGLAPFPASHQIGWVTRAIFSPPPIRPPSGGGIVTAVLGPTNTGKTHLAVERMCGHTSGMIGFPLRLLAREVYDRVVAIKGAHQVALITGEEKIVPENARYFLCTMEAMPLDKSVSFVAIDEAQLGADPERGHVFTDRLLNIRGYAETMILGSETLKPLIRKLLPEAEIVTRPRFSTLSYAGAKKLSRLPRRSAIVAFTAAEVYALAEMLRRQKGGAAVVMGSLSPSTRNAQVALYQSGEVDYLVATDAIGMGLNMDISHVAFASLSKFDGRRHRRLTLSEMAQIAGRAGRYQKDGSFGTVQLGTEAAAQFTPEEIEGLEEHRFEPLTQLVWRNTALDFASPARLITTLDARPPRPELLRGDDAIDLAVLKAMAGEPWVMERMVQRFGNARGVARLWAACGLPDYRKTGPEQHGKLVARIFRHLSEGSGTLPDAWIASELAHLDRVTGDVETIADRIAAARTWTYIAHRPDWLDNPGHWAERARGVEERLSDALHAALTQRFVDRRTAVLLKDLKVRGGEQRVEIDPDGAVAVEGEVIGRLDGFHFSPDPLARAGEQRMLLAAAERHLVHVLAQRAEALAAADNSAFAMAFAGAMPPHILWQGARVGSFRKGRDALSPRLQLDRALATLAPVLRAQVQARLEAWIASAITDALGPLVQMQAHGAALSPGARGLIVRLVETLGVLPRAAAEDQLAALVRGDRQVLAAAGARLGVTHVFVPKLLRPGATRWRLALWAVWSEQKALPPLPAPGRVSLTIESGWPAGFLETAGFWRIGEQAVRIDIVDRLARAVHGHRDGRAPFMPDPHWAASAGLSHDGLARLLRALGYKPQLVDGAQHFAWRGARRLEMRRQEITNPQNRPQDSADQLQEGAPDARTRAPSPFSVLADVRFESAGQGSVRRSRFR